MARAIAVIGGVVVLFGTIVSFFYAVLGWYTLQVSGSVTGEGALVASTSAIGGVTAMGDGILGALIPSGLPFISLSPYMVPGILAIVGALFCGSKKRIYIAVGGLITCAGLVVFIATLVVQISAIASIFGGSLPGLSGSESLQLIWSSQTIGDYTIILHIGYGFFITLAGALVQIIRALPKY